MIRIAFYSALPILVLLVFVWHGEFGVPIHPELPKPAEVPPPDPAAFAKAIAAAIPADASAEQLFSSTCATCHGESGEGNAEFKAPSIAGLPDWFLQIQFSKFRDGLRGEGEGDDSGAQMKLIAEKLNDEQMTGLASLISALPLHPMQQELGGDPVIGRERFMENCASCHRYNAHGEKAFRSAPLSSLQDWYVYDSLIKFRDEVRGYHSQDVDGIFMHRNLKYLTDEDFLNIVACIATLAEKYPPDQRRPRSRSAIQTEDGERRSTSLFPEPAPAPPPAPTPAPPVATDVDVDSLFTPAP